MSARSHEWRAKIIRELHDINWNDPDLSALSTAQQDAIDAIINRTSRDLCALAGHEPTGDQCGIPAHDFCLWCLTPMPGTANRSAA